MTCEMMGRLVKVYEGKVVEKGKPEGLLGMPEDTKARLDILRSMLNSVRAETGNATLNILDVGCGYADLYDLIDKGDVYVGVEYIDWIVAYAKEVRPSANIPYATLSEALEDNEPASFDVVVAAGLMSTMNPVLEREFMEGLTSLSSCGAIVSFLDPTNYTGRLRTHTPTAMMDLTATPTLAGNLQRVRDGDERVALYFVGRGV